MTANASNRSRRRRTGREGHARPSGSGTAPCRSNLRVDGPLVSGSPTTSRPRCTRPADRLQRPIFSFAFAAGFALPSQKRNGPGGEARRGRPSRSTTPRARRGREDRRHALHRREKPPAEGPLPRRREDDERDDRRGRERHPGRRSRRELRRWRPIPARSRRRHPLASRSPGRRHSAPGVPGRCLGAFGFRRLLDSEPGHLRLEESDRPGQLLRDLAELLERGVQREEVRPVGDLLDRRDVGAGPLGLCAELGEPRRCRPTSPQLARPTRRGRGGRAPGGRAAEPRDLRSPSKAGDGSRPCLSGAARPGYRCCRTTSTTSGRASSPSSFSRSRVGTPFGVQPRRW